MEFDNVRQEKFYLPVTGGGYHLAGHERPDHTGHDDFEFREGRSSRFLCPSLGLNLCLY